MFLDCDDVDVVFFATQYYLMELVCCVGYVVAGTRWQFLRHDLCWRQLWRRLGFQSDTGATRHCPRLVGFPEFVPMVVLSGFGEGTQMAHAFGRPELSRTFEAALLLAAG